MIPRTLNAVIRFDLMESYMTKNSNNLYFKYNPTAPKRRKYYGKVLIEKVVDINTLFVSKTFINFIRNLYRVVETDNLDYVIQDLYNFFNSENEFLLSQNNKTDYWFLILIVL